MWDWKDKCILVTGGGSIGSVLVGVLLGHPVRAVRVFDNSEQALFDVEQTYPDARMRFLLGDVTDYDRVLFAMKGADCVIHTACNKFVNFIEYNPFQALRTNIDGTVNVVRAAIETGSVKKVVYIGSDKAVNPCNIYGHTKAIGELIFRWGQRMSDGKVFSTVRLPNVCFSRGSVTDIWRRQKEMGRPITLTDERMERYFVTMEQAIELILRVVEISEGGEVFIPEAREEKIVDLAKEFSADVKVIGPRLGERLREDLWTEEEAKRMEKIGDIYVIKRGG